MVVLGIVLIVLVVLLGLGVAVSSTESTTLEVFGVDFGMMVTTVFFLGAAAGVLVIIGLWLTRKGLSRSYRRHKEVKELRQQVEAAPATTPAAAPAPDHTGAHAPDDTGAHTSDHTGAHASDRPEAHAPDHTEVHTSDDAGASDERLAEQPHTVADGTDPRHSSHHPGSA